MAVIGINYNDGGDPLDYKSVYLHSGGNDKEFDSGIFVRDWIMAKKYYLEIMEKDPYLCHSSSVDHFIMDGAPYDSAYLMFEQTKPPYLVFDYNEDGWEMFVPKGTEPTWEELKNV